MMIMMIYRSDLDMELHMCQKWTIEVKAFKS